MRWSRAFLPTLREAPAAAGSPGRSLLFRAACVRGEALLPLGLRALRKVEALIGEELGRAGAQEVRASDLLALARGDLKSYRQLPLILSRVQDARHEAAGFDLDERSQAKSFQALLDACVRVFARAELPVRRAEAMDGQVFFADADAEGGEDTLFACPGCAWAAERDAAPCPPPRLDASSGETRQILPLQELATPGASTVEELTRALGVPSRLLLKTLIYRTTPPGFVAALVRGDHDVNEAKLRRAAGVDAVELASPEEILRETGGPVGFSGPIGLKLRTIADSAVLSMTNFVTGANKADAHFANVTIHRDFRPGSVADLRVAREGDPCPRCGAPLGLVSGLELGRVVKPAGGAPIEVDGGQGRRSPLRRVASALDLGKLLRAVAEKSRDDAGLLWPRALAPFAVEILSLNAENLQIAEAARTLYEELGRAGLETLWDDREAAPGVKFADADLLGLPVRITVGKRLVDDGTVDVRARRKKDQTNVPIERVLETVNHELSELPA